MAVFLKELLAKALPKACRGTLAELTSTVVTNLTLVAVPAVASALASKLALKMQRSATRGLLPLRREGAGMPKPRT